MGQKVNPHGARVGVIKDWSARWYANKKDFSNYLVEDHALRTMLKEKLFGAGISHIDIERASNKVTVNIFTAKPGIVIGRGGAGAEALKKEIEAFTGKAVSLNILEIKQPELTPSSSPRRLPSPWKSAFLPPCDEAEPGLCDARRRQGNQDAGLRPPGRRGNRAVRGVS